MFRCDGSPVSKGSGFGSCLKFRFRFLPDRDFTSIWISIRFSFWSAFNVQMSNMATSDGASGSLEYADDSTRYKRIDLLSGHTVKEK
jgi:hypothetical protein